MGTLLLLGIPGCPTKAAYNRACGIYDDTSGDGGPCGEPPADSTYTWTDVDADADPDADTEADIDADIDVDVDSDTETTGETGLAYGVLLGYFNVDGATFESGWFGIGMYGLRMQDFVCTVGGPLAYEGAAVSGCPDCEWAFNLGPVTSGEAEGDYCEDMGIADDALDGTRDASWGFTYSYVYVNDNGAYPLEDVVWYSYQDNWYLIAYNYNDGYQVYHSGGYTSFARLFYPYSYYYYDYHP